MKMEKMPEVTRTSEGVFWNNTYEKFDADDFKKILKNSFIHKLRYTFDKKKIKIDFDGSYLQFILDNDLDYILKFSPR